MGQLWRRSGSLEFDENGDRAPGAQAFFFVGNTTTPLTVYQDAGESTPHEHPVEADADGRWPAVFIPYIASFDEQITTGSGTQLSYFELIPNPNPVEEAEDSVDETALARTGQVCWEPIAGTRSGWVRLNARTIGSATSGATERANDDCEDLFVYYWNNLSNAQAAVSGGRGASAAADWAANKQIALLDGKSSFLMGLDDMGGSAASRLGSAPFSNGNATTPGSVVGANTHTLISAELPAHDHTFAATTSSEGAHTHTGTVNSDGAHSHTITISDPGHSHTGSAAASNFNATAAGGGNLWGSSNQSGVALSINGNTTGITASSNSTGAHTHTFTTGSSGAHTHTISGTTSSVGSGDAHNIVSRALLGTFFQKL